MQRNEGTHSCDYATGNEQMSVDNEDTHSRELGAGTVQTDVDFASLAHHRPPNTDNSERVVVMTHNSSLDKRANVSGSNCLESSPCINGDSFSQDHEKCELGMGNIQVSSGNLTNEPGNTVEKKGLKELVEDKAQRVDDDNSNKTKFKIKVKEIKSESDDFVSRKRNETISTSSNKLEIISRLFYRRRDEIPFYAIREYHFNNNIYPVADGYESEEFRAICKCNLASFGRRGIVPDLEFRIQVREYMSRRRNRGVVPLCSSQDLPMHALLHCGRALNIQAVLNWLDLRPQQMSESGDQNVVSLHLFRESTDPLVRIYKHQQELNTHLSRYGNTNEAYSENGNGNGEENSVSTVFQPVNESHQENHLSTFQIADTETCAMETWVTNIRVNVPEPGLTCECVVGAAVSCACNRTKKALSDGSHFCVDASLSTPETEQLRNAEQYNSSGTPKHRKYLYKRWRLRSYDSAPHTIRLKKLQMMRAGFFYTGQGQVVCFHCGGCLAEWQAGDMPLHEHRRHFPDCTFVRTLSDLEEALFVCIVCQQNDIEVMFLPCYHEKCCEDCSKDIKNCPFCCSIITEKVCAVNDICMQ